MALTPAERKRRQRAKERGEQDPFEGKAVQDAKHEEHLAWAIMQDATEKFYKSECRSAVKLLDFYEGRNNVGVDDPDEDDKKKKQNIPNPSITPIRIQAIQLEDGTQVDPGQYRDTYEISRVVSFPEWLELRNKARKDLFWLARLLGLDFYHGTHQIMCDMFVKKNFDELYFPGFNRGDVHDMIEKQERYADDGTPTRTMLLFAPRSSFKSTADGVDAVQWLLNCPNIRILIATSGLRLSKELLVEIKKYFFLAEQAEPTSLHLLFPEYILTGVKGTSEKAMVCPARTYESKEPHLWVTSLDSSFVGSRCDIRKIDDAVEDKNSANNELREGLKEKIKSTNALVEPWGFTDVIGTRYFTQDWYGWRMGQVPEPGEEADSSTEPFAYMCISAWTPKSEFAVEYQKLLDTPGGVFKVTEEMVDLFFPKKLSFKTLRTKLREYKERGFKNQYLNIATDPQEMSDYAVHFSREALRAGTYALSAAPVGGEELVTIDWSYSDNKGSDYSVLSAIRRHVREDNTQELIVHDIDYDKWKSSDLVRHIILFLRKHNPRRTLLEGALGIELLMMALNAQAARMGCPEVLRSIQIIPVDNSKNAKMNRIKTLEILLADGRLHFVAGTWIDELYRQFERFTGEIKKGRKDDIPDGISIASRTLPQEMFTAMKVDPEYAAQEAEKTFKKQAKAAHYQRVFGVSADPSFQRLASDFSPNTGPPEPIIEVQKPQDPRMKIFGNKGPWRL